MVKAEVIARVFNPATGLPKESGGKEHSEVIDLDTNKLFKDCKTLTDIVEAYMRFWNRLPTYQSEMVLVQSIRWIVPPP